MILSVAFSLSLPLFLVFLPVRAHRPRGCSAQFGSVRLVWVLALGHTVSFALYSDLYRLSHSLASHNSTWLIQLVSGPFVSQLPLSSALLSARLFLFSFCLLSVSFSSQFIFSFAQDIRISFHLSFSFCALAGKTTSKSRIKSMHNELNLTLLCSADPCHKKGLAFQCTFSTFVVEQ